MSSCIPRCCGLIYLTGLGLLAHTQDARALDKWQWLLHICKLGGGLHPFVSEEKIKDEVGVG